MDHKRGGMKAIEKYQNKKGLKKQVTIDSIIFRSDFHRWRKIFRALFARTLLLGHAILAIWLVSRDEPKYLGFYVPCVILFLIETGTILYFRNGCEWNRICTCFLTYLISVVPMLWLLRLDDISRSLNTTTRNETLIDTKTTPTTTTMHLHTPPSALLQLSQSTKIVIEKLFYENRASYLEQAMMFLIIICRWLLPRGRINRNTISQLLIMYSAISADILDFSEIMDQDQIKQDDTFKFVVLGVWTWSLVQFIIVITTAFHFRKRQDPTNGKDKAFKDSEDASEKLSILMIFFMQDGPFLVTRVIAIFWLGALDYQIIFFSLKNLLTIILGLYRLLVLYGCVTKEGNDLLRKSEIARSIESLDELDSVSTVNECKKPMKKGKKQKKSKESQY